MYNYSFSFIFCAYTHLALHQREIRLAARLIRVRPRCWYRY